MTNPFGMSDPRCICHRQVKNLLQAELTGTERPLCEIHEAPAIAARAAEVEAAGHQATADRLRDAIADVKADDDLEARRQARAARDVADDAIADPLERSLRRLVHRPTGPNLNSSNAAYHRLFSAHHDGDDAA